MPSGHTASWPSDLTVSRLGRRAGGERPCARRSWAANRELAVLEECLASALAGRPRPGALPRGARDREDAAGGGAVLHGRVGGRRGRVGTGAGGCRCPAVLAVAADPARRGRPCRPASPGAGDHRLTAELARLAPDLFSGEPDEADGPGTAEDRFRLFDAVDRLLRLLSQDRPLLIVLDDAHWADDSSLLLLQHLADSMAAQRLLLVVNHRDTEPLGDVLLAGLARLPRRALWRSAASRLRTSACSWPRSWAGSCPTATSSRCTPAPGAIPFYVAEVGRALVDRARRARRVAGAGRCPGGHPCAAGEALPRDGPARCRPPPSWAASSR